MTTLFDFFFHLDEVLNQLLLVHPYATYLLVFCIIFTESAFFPLSPFLPGDGLLFTIGILAASGAINIWLVVPVLILGGVLGNEVAYSFGLRFGPLLFEKFSWLNKKEYDQAHAFYQKHGSRAFIFSRFIPIVRSLVPFVAGVAKMKYADFCKYNILSVSIWVISITVVALLLGSIPFLRQYFIMILTAFMAATWVSIFLLGFLRFFRKTTNQ